MKINKVLSLVFLAVSTLTLLGAAQSSSAYKPAGAVATKANSSSSAKETKAGKVHAPVNADEVYKANCTRCHAEAVKVNSRATVTVMQHMRARANVTQDEMTAMIKYLQQ